MKRLWQSLFDLLSTTSLVLCLATVALWPFSFTTTGIGYSKSGSHWSIGLHRGELNLRFRDYPVPMGVPLPQSRAYVQNVPLWIVVGVLTILPIFRFARWRRALTIETRRNTGRCLVCGYDLRATPDRCPECGAIPQKIERISNRPTTNY